MDPFRRAAMHDPRVEPPLNAADELAGLRLYLRERGAAAIHADRARRQAIAVERRKLKRPV